MGLIGRAFAVVGALVLALVGLAAYLYFTDHAIEAELTEKSAPGESPAWVVATTRVGGFEIRKEVTPSAWAALDVGNHVEYHVQTGKTRVYDREGGRLLYET